MLEFTYSIDAWNADATGDWAKDNAIGRERANALRAHIQMTGNYPLLGTPTRAAVLRIDAWG